VLGNGELARAAEYLKGYLDQGRLGVKSGRGFYVYENGHESYESAERAPAL
jgi:3-hydroxyacyl-CoA dehydrogenase